MSFSSVCFMKMKAKEDLDLFQSFSFIESFLF